MPDRPQLRLLVDQAKGHKKRGVFDNGCTVKPCDVGHGLVGGVASSGVAVLMFFEDGVDCKAVWADDGHEVKNAVVDAGMRGAAFHQCFFLGIYGQGMVGSYTTFLAKSDRITSRRCCKHHGACPFLPLIIFQPVKFLNGFFALLPITWIMLAKNLPAWALCWFFALILPKLLVTLLPK